MARLKSVKLLRERVARWDEYPFSIPPIASLEALELRSPVCFFVGENGTGKSTLLEAIAAHYGFGREGGNLSTPNENFPVRRSKITLLSSWMNRSERSSRI